jgi:hypothetical protein
MKILKENSYDPQETQITNHSKNTRRVYQNYFASNLFESFGFLNPEPEVQGQVKPLNCIILQLLGKFTLAHIY